MTTVDILPSGDYFTGLVRSDGWANFQCVQGLGGHVQTSNPNNGYSGTDVYNTSPSIPSNAIISNVRVTVGFGTSIVSFPVDMQAGFHNQFTFSANTTSSALVYHDSTTNPNTGLPWTASDVNAMKLTLYLMNTAAQALSGLIKATVTYTLPGRRRVADILAF